MTQKMCRDSVRILGLPQQLESDMVPSLCFTHYILVFKIILIVTIYLTSYHTLQRLKTG